jgi:hypothetical protein
VCNTCSGMDVEAIGKRLRSEASKATVRRSPRGFLNGIAGAAGEALRSGMSSGEVCKWLWEKEGVKVSKAGLLKALRRNGL